LRNANAHWLEDRLRRREAERKAAAIDKIWFQGNEMPVAEVAARIFPDGTIPSASETRNVGGKSSGHYGRWHGRNYPGALAS